MDLKAIEKSITDKTLQVFPNTSLPLILSGMFLSFVLFFISPVFFNQNHTMNFAAYLPAWDFTGADLGQLRSYCVSWFMEHKTPYIGLNLYPPLVIWFFSPLFLLPLNTAYAVITSVSLAAYILASLFIPKLMLSVRGDFSTFLLFFLTGLLSYGLQFELERGQFNLIAFAFAMLAVYLYHYHPGLRLLAYVLLTVSVQLKVYPAIFILMFVDDWSNWKENIRKIAGFIFVNFLLLFALGYAVFTDFIQALQKQMLAPPVSLFNHSIKSFADIFFRKTGFRDVFMEMGMSGKTLQLLGNYTFLIQVALFFYAAVCLFVIVSREVSLNSRKISPRLLLTCTLFALLIPSISIDYKLPLLAGPAALFIQEVGAARPKKTFSPFMIFLFSFVYSTMLFSYAYKPLFLSNNLPALLTLLTMAAVSASRDNITMQESVPVE